MEMENTSYIGNKTCEERMLIIEAKLNYLYDAVIDIKYDLRDSILSKKKKEAENEKDNQEQLIKEYENAETAKWFYREEEKKRFIETGGN